MVKHVAPRYSFYIWYFVNILEHKFKKRIFFKVTLLNEFFSFSEMKDLYLASSQRHWFYKFLVRGYYNFRQTFKILVFVIFFRDTTLFMNWFTWVMRKIKYRSIKKFLFFLKSLLLNFLLPSLSKQSGVVGFHFDIRGKVGVAGDSKKRHFAIRWGSPSFTSKKYKFSLKQGLVPSYTGVMGVTVLITHI